MVKIRVKVVGSGAQDDPFRVDLPTYYMVPGTEELTGPDKKVLTSVVVEIPADECDEKGRPDKARIRAKYKGQPRWDHDNLLKDVV